MVQVWDVGDKKRSLRQGRRREDEESMRSGRSERKSLRDRKGEWTTAAAVLGED